MLHLGEVPAVQSNALLSLQEQQEHKRQQQEKQALLKNQRHAPEPFETKRLEAVRQAIKKDSPYEPKFQKQTQHENDHKVAVPAPGSPDIPARFR